MLLIIDCLQAITKGSVLVWFSVDNEKSVYYFDVILGMGIWPQ